MKGLNLIKCLLIMRTKFVVSWVLLILCLTLQAQDSVSFRIIFIGDAGEINSRQTAVIKNASEHILQGKTAVIYLGDNIYPKGMALPGSPLESEAHKIIQSQYVPLRSKGAPVFFIPGNHDWNESRKEGLMKIKRADEYLNQQNDSLLQLVPHNGCPGPYEINLSGNLTVIAFDSEWWLHALPKNNPAGACDCKTEDEFIARLDEMIYRNRHKIILLASHHPFQSYGRHGGYFSWKDHLFPLTAVNKSLYIPLPIIGSLYPLLRKTFLNPEDLGHSVYKEMIKRIDSAFAAFPNLIHVAGHEHTLQLIKTGQIQVVSGAGSKEGYVRKGKNALFAKNTNGYVTADLLLNNDLRFSFYTYADTGFHAAFTYTQPYTDMQGQRNASPASQNVLKGEYEEKRD